MINYKSSTLNKANPHGKPQGFKKVLDKKNQFPLIIILIVVAVVLGLAIYKQHKPQPSVLPPTESTVPKLMSPDLTQDEKAVLNPPSPDAPAAEKDIHDALAAKLSKESDSLDITNCRSDPLVVRIKINENLKVKNNDNIDRKLIIDDTHIYEIAKNSTTSIKVDFGHGVGLYGYICEGIGLTGFILVTP